MADPANIEASADVADSARLGAGTRVWHLAQIRENAILGSDCTIGRGAYVGPGVVLGNACKIQNHALVYEPARLGDGVFIGPAAVVTKDVPPHALMVGTPARRIGWVGRVGKPLEREGDRWVCPESGERYVQVGDALRLAD